MTKFPTLERAKRHECQRSLMAAFAALQWLLPALVFGLAAWAGRARRFAPPAGAVEPSARQKLSHTVQ